jgi:hypothetical protein
MTYAASGLASALHYLVPDPAPMPITGIVGDVLRAAGYPAHYPTSHVSHDLMMFAYLVWAAEWGNRLLALNLGTDRAVLQAALRKWEIGLAEAMFGPRSKQITVEARNRVWAAYHDERNDFSVCARAMFPQLAR